jgi:hypothetical protein
VDHRLQDEAIGIYEEVPLPPFNPCMTIQATDPSKAFTMLRVIRTDTG